MQLTYDENIDMKHLKSIPTRKTGCSISVYEKVDKNNTLI